MIVLSNHLLYTRFPQSPSSYLSMYSIKRFHATQAEYRSQKENFTQKKQNEKTTITCKLEWTEENIE